MLPQHLWGHSHDVFGHVTIW